MVKTIEKYTTDAEAVTIKTLYAAKYLVEVQNHEDGKFLVFDDQPLPGPAPTVEERLAILEAANTDLEGRLTTIEAVKAL